MKFLEELSSGECFEHNQIYYIVSTDFKGNKSRMCLCLKNGFVSWIPSDTMVDGIDIFTMDSDNNMLAMKAREKNDFS